MHRQPRPLARQARRQRAQGIEIEEKVWQLCVTGKRQTAIAAHLNLSESRVSRYVSRRLQRIEENAIRTPDQLAYMREIIAARLEATIEATHPNPEIVFDAGGKPAPVEIPATAPMLAIRLKALDQLAKLYGLNMVSQPHTENVMPYLSPPEVAAAVQEHILAMYGRSHVPPVTSPILETGV